MVEGPQESRAQTAGPGSSSERLAQQISEIKETLQKSNFPYKVDLVMRSEFAQSYLPGFERDKKLFQWAQK